MKTAWTPFSLSHVRQIADSWPGVRAARGVGVVGPEDHHLRVAHHVLQIVERLGHAEAPVEAVGVGGAPVPALPAVRVVEDGGGLEAVHEAHERAHLVADDAPVVVRRGHAADGRVAVLLAHARDLARDDVQRLVPGDALVGRLAAVLRVALAVRVEVDALHRVLDAVVGVEAPALGEHHRRHVELLGRGVLLAARLDHPGAELGLVGHQRTDTGHDTVGDVHRDRPVVRQISEDLLTHMATSSAPQAIGDKGLASERALQPTLASRTNADIV